MAARIKTVSQADSVSVDDFGLLARLVVPSLAVTEVCHLLSDPRVPLLKHRSQTLCRVTVDTAVLRAVAEVLLCPLPEPGLRNSRIARVGAPR